MLKYGFEQYEIRTIYLSNYDKNRTIFVVYRYFIYLCVTILIDFVAVIHKQLYKGDKGYVLTSEDNTNTIQIDCLPEGRGNRDG